MRSRVEEALSTEEFSLIVLRFFCTWWKFRCEGDGQKKRDHRKEERKEGTREGKIEKVKKNEEREGRLKAVGRTRECERCAGGRRRGIDDDEGRREKGAGTVH